MEASKIFKCLGALTFSKACCCLPADYFLNRTERNGRLKYKALCYSKPRWPCLWSTQETAVREQHREHFFAKEVAILGSSRENWRLLWDASNSHNLLFAISTFENVLLRTLLNICDSFGFATPVNWCVDSCQAGWFSQTHTLLPARNTMASMVGQLGTDVASIFFFVN